MVGVGNRLADLRRSRGLSQEEVVAGLGVSRQAVSNWERGEAAPDYWTTWWLWPTATA